MKDFPELFFSDFGTCSRDIPMHTHAQMEWVFVRRGNFTARFTGYGTLYGGPGDVFVIPAGIEHDQAAVPDGENVYALIGGLDAAVPRMIRCGGDQLLRQWFWQLPLLSRDRSEAGEKHLFTGMLWERMRRADGEMKEAGGGIHPALRRALDTVSRNLRGSCTAGSVVKAAGISRSHLNMLFHQKFGCGLSAYINTARLDCAKELLRSPYLSVGEAAERSGFSGANYFCRLFRKKFGMTPGEYRDSTRRPAAADQPETPEY